MNIISTVIWLALAFPQQDSPVKAGPSGELSEVVRDFVEHARQHPDGRAAFTIDLASWSMLVGTAPIPITIPQPGGRDRCADNAARSHAGGKRRAVPGHRRGIHG